MTMSEGSPGFNGRESPAPSENGAVQSSVPVVVLTVHDRLQEESLKHQSQLGTHYDEDDFLPLPASKFRYSKWHELDEMDIKGNMLRSPRVRRAPKGFKKDTIKKIVDEEMQDESDDEDFRPVIPMRKSRKPRFSIRNNFRNKMENWENAESANLSYQDLGDPFQKKEFLRVIRRLIRCEHIQLIEDSLQDLSSVYLPRCTHLYLQRNFLFTFKKLPRSPMLEHLSLQQNNIEKLDGLEVLRKTRLKSLVLKGNPVELDPNYRQSVFRILPYLEELDGIPKLETDEDDAVITKTCIVS